MAKDITEIEAVTAECVRIAHIAVIGESLNCGEQFFAVGQVSNQLLSRAFDDSELWMTLFESSQQT